MTKSNRTCGECTLCCRLLPVKADKDRAHQELARALYRGQRMLLIDKKAGHKCKYQFSGGCRVYQQRPMSCRLWACRWLHNDDTADLSRPDRSGYVIDMVPDFIEARNDETGEKYPPIQVVQIWIDPKRASAWRNDKHLRAYLIRRAAEGTAAILRYSSQDAIIVFAGPPLVTEWTEVSNATMVPAGETWPENAREILGGGP
jgi:hypothetical protein